MEKQLSPTPRIEVVDALRGFAILAIFLIHNLEHFIFPVYPENSPEWLDVMNQGVFNIIFSLFAGKAYAIFALLFGLTFFIQSNNQKRRGKDFGYRFLWRMVLLVGFAALNAAFFPAGDVLLLFAAVSIVLFITRNWSDKAVLIASVFFLLQPVEWFHYVTHLVNPAYQLPDLKVGEMYSEVAAYTMAGNPAEFFFKNIGLGQKASLFWAIGAGRISQTAGLFLLGFYMGRKHLFEDSAKNLHVWIKILIVSAVLFSPLYALKEAIMENDLGIIRRTVGTAFDMWQKLAFTMVLVSSFIIMYRNKRFYRLTSDFRFYGKMSLTNYITQSVIGAFIYFPVGLFLAPYCGYTLSLLIGIVAFFLQIAFCKWWLRRHRQGPLEYVWHKWTWLRM